MNSVRKWIRDIFGFSGNEINGFLILLPLMLLLLLSEPLYRRWTASRATPQQDTAMFDSLIALWSANEGSHTVRRVDPFPFDPNTASIGDLRNLGFDGTMANRIAAYRRKGGVFRIKSDLMRIYGLDSALYTQLYRYIALPVSAGPVPDKPFPERKKRAERHPFPSRRTGPEQKFDINTADTLLLKSVYGIGSRLAARIIKFRDGLGGFVRPEQLSEVYGLDSTTVMRLQEVCFIREGFVPGRININTATEDMLSGHPYISYRLARRLVSYRIQHGDFRDVNDIKKLLAVPPAELDRLLPYLTVEDIEPREAGMK